MNPLIPLCAAVLAAFAPPVACQTPAELTEDPAVPVIAADQMVLEFLTVPDGMDDDMLSSLMQLNRREIVVRNRDGSVRGPLENCQESDRGMLVYDTADYVKSIKDALAKIVAEVPRQSELVLKTDVYVPRFVDVQRLANLLEPLRRPVMTRTSNGAWQQSPNVTSQSSPAMIVMNDTPEQVERMQDLLARIDQAPPQMLITCWLVRGSFDTDLDSASLPPVLLENLQRLLPYKEYGLVTTAMVRTSILAGSERSLSGSFGPDGEFELQLQPGAVDGTGHRLAFDRIEFKSSEGQRFDTSAVLDFEDYTVLGAAGREPLLVVLQVKPAQR